MGKKAKVKLNLQGKTIPEKIQFGRQIATQLTGNTNFPNPVPPVAQITVVTNDLEKAYNDSETARDVAKAKTDVMKDKEAAFDLAITNEGLYVENIAKGDATLIKSAGMDVKGENTTTAAKSSMFVNTLNASVGDNEGEIDLHWDRVVKARSYQIQYCKDPLGSETWQFAGSCTRSQYTVSHLESGKKYWFRVAAVTTEGEGPWSDPVAKIVQ